MSKTREFHNLDEAQIIHFTLIICIQVIPKVNPRNQECSRICNFSLIKFMSRSGKVVLLDFLIVFMYFFLGFVFM